MQTKLPLQVQAPASVTKPAAAALEDSKKEQQEREKIPASVVLFLMLKH